MRPLASSRVAGRRSVGRTSGLSAALALTVLLGTGAHLDAQGTIDGARTAFREGEYEEALATLRSLAGSASSSWQATELHARVLAEVGRYGEALGVLQAFEGEGRLELSTAEGEILLALGRWDDAEQAFGRAVRAHTGSYLLALLRTGEVWALRGRADDAAKAFDQFIDIYNGGGTLSAEDLYAVGLAVGHLGARRSVLSQDALRALDEAAAAAPGDPRPTLAIGDLFLGRYNSTEAHDAYREVLARNPNHPDALLGEARALEFDGDGAALATVKRALEVNPDHVAARTFLARQYLRAEQYDGARREAERALEVNPNSLQALSVLAATHYLRGDEAAYRSTRDRVLTLNPAFADLFNTIAELAVDLRKYQGAVTLATEAVAHDSLSWRGWGLLGLNRLRVGAMDQGRADLERAFAGDPYNPWFKNTLDLLDTFARYRTVETEHFSILLRDDEADLLSPYVSALAEEAYAALRARYGSEPPTPIRLEIFPRHADFSVRTLGLVGLGALGVSFGSTLVMDSPSAREAGEFNWESTLWHELSHAFHLAMTDHNVPRWFSEGLAVREQRVASPSWGPHVGVPFLRAYQAGNLHPVSELNEGFVRPSFPGELQLSYYEASLVFDWIEERFGFRVVRAFLDGYRDGRTTAQLMGDVLGLSATDVDRVFDDYVRERFASELRATAVTGAAAGPMALGPERADLAALRQAVRQRPGDFSARLAFGRALFESGSLDEAEPELRAALRLFPAYGNPDGPLRYLARIAEARGDLRGAADALRAQGDLGESLYRVHLEEAALRRQLGDRTGEREALAHTIEIFPYDLDVHLRLAELLASAGDAEGVVRERRAILGLEPADLADAHYRLALALRDADRLAEARTQVLRALELAPGFEAALDLLLELRGRKP